MENPFLEDCYFIFMYSSLETFDLPQKICILALVSRENLFSLQISCYIFFSISQLLKSMHCMQN